MKKPLALHVVFKKTSSPYNETSQLLSFKRTF